MAGKNLNVGLISSILIAVIVIIIVFRALADTGDDMGYASDNFSSARINADFAYEGADVYPLTSFFKKRGVILLAFMAGIVIVMVSAVLKFKGK